MADDLIPCSGLHDAPVDHQPDAILGSARHAVVPVNLPNSLGRFKVSGAAYFCTASPSIRIVNGSFCMVRSIARTTVCWPRGNDID